MRVRWWWIVIGIVFGYFAFDIAASIWWMFYGWPGR
jgi:hypothetical protein